MEVDNRSAPIAVTVMRISLGGMFISHSLYLKHFIFTLAGTAEYFESIGLPGPFAYVVFVAEVVGGAMLIVGIQTRWVAAALSPVLAGAIWAHWGNGWMFGYENGGWEYPAYLTLLAVCQCALGDGRFALIPSKSITKIASTPQS